MSPSEAIRITRVLAEIYRRDEWTPERHQIWAALIGDLDFAATQRAVMAWASSERWPPTPAEIRELVASERRRESSILRLPAPRNRTEVNVARWRELKAAMRKVGELPA